MSAGRPRAAVAGRRAGKRARLTEAHWQAQVEGLAAFYGWRVYHTHDSRLVMVRGPELIFAELKGESTRVTKEQEGWLAALHEVSNAVGGLRVAAANGAHYPEADPAVDVYLWRAPDLDPVHERLARGRRRTEPIGAT